jgi:4-amino-4-deoxy-L-arabinose transferase-like glycosyltransferase
MLGQGQGTVGAIVEDRPEVSEARRLKLMLLAVFVVGGLHAALYAVSFPPWAIEDEEQHVDYVWKVAFDHRMPDLDDPLDQSVVDSAASTDRWGDYGLPRPPAFVPEAMGLEGYSYEAYHPPLGYAVLAPVAVVIGDRALLLMYVLRAVSVLVAGAVCALTALLAWRWSQGSEHRLLVAGSAGLAAAAMPALADSGGRVNIDLFAALLVVAGVLAIMRWLDGPSSRRAWAVGALFAAAVLTRETAVVLGVAVAAAGVVAWQRRDLRMADAARVLIPPVALGSAWVVHFWRSTGYLDPSEALRDRLGTHHPYHGMRDFLQDLGERAFVPYGDWPLPVALTILLALVATVGLVLALRNGAGLPAVLGAGTVLAAVVLVLQQAREGSTTVSARLLLPAYPVALAAATVGWGSLRPRWSSAVMPAAVAGFGVVFLVGSFLPEYSPGLG